MDPELLNLPLGVKIPVAPGSEPVLFRGKLGEKLLPPYPYFHLDDPYLHQFSLEYNCLHDPSLEDYHKRKDILRILKRRGLVTRDNKVVCTVKEFNDYRDYLTKIKLESEKFLEEIEEGPLPPLAKLKDGPKLPEATACRGKWWLQPQKSSSLPPPKSRKSGRCRKGRAALDEGQTYSRDHSWNMEVMAKELIAAVLEILRDRLASSTSKASESGMAARWTELPVAGRATQADKSKDTETPTAGGALSQTSLDTLTREVVESVHCTLESFVTPQFEQDTSFEHAEILELPGENVSNRQLKPSQTLPRQAVEAGQGSPRASEQQSLKAMLPATAEGAGYAKTMEPEDCATVKKNLQRKMNLESTALANTLDVRTMANQIADSVLERISQPEPAPAPEENFQGPVANLPTSQGRTESCAAEDTLPSVDPCSPSLQPRPEHCPEQSAQSSPEASEVCD